jgi:hypothetical protein
VRRGAAVWARLATYGLALRHNLTLLYHPFLPNQRENFLFERFFGLGYDEPYRFYEACTEGAVGEQCTAFLPCLQVRALGPYPPPTPRPYRKGRACVCVQMTLGRMCVCVCVCVCVCMYVCV